MWWYEKENSTNWYCSFMDIRQKCAILWIAYAEEKSHGKIFLMDMKKTAEELDTQAELLIKIKRMCGDNGIVMNLHNHTYEVENNEYELRENIKRIPDIKLGPDLNWLLRAGIDPFDFLRRYKERVAYMHVRDQRGTRWKEHYE